MDIAPLTLAHCSAWAQLLAISFDRQVDEMEQLLAYLHVATPFVAWGAWDDGQLIAQYGCLLRTLCLPQESAPVMVGMSVNMAVHPDYRGRGLIKQVAQPVYEAITAQGCVAGVGFSNAAGVQVDKRSKGYGYQVVGQLVSTLAWLRQRPSCSPLHLTTQWPEHPFADCLPRHHHIQFATTAVSLQHRFAHHPFRRYHFGIWQDDGYIQGMVVYRPFRRAGLPGVALLAAYGADLGQLLGQWVSALWQTGIRFIHVLTSPQAPPLQALRQTAVCLTLPYTRSPYYLTVKPLHSAVSPHWFNLTNWNCIGGDIL